MVHLAGESAASGRWTDERKRQIMDSRVNGTRAVVDAMRGGRARVLVSASGIDYYAQSDEALDESGPPGESFLGEVTRA